MGTARARALPGLVVAAFAGLLGGAEAGVIGRDDRVMLNRLQNMLNSPERMLGMAAHASGLITCDNGRFGSASLVMRADIVVTAAHLFFGEAQRLRSGAVRCIYIPDGLPTSRRYDVMLGTLRVGAERVTGVNICSNGRDWAVVRLREAVPGVVPYALGAGTGVAPVGSALAMVSHGGGSGALRGPGGHAGRCTLRDHVGPCRQTGIPLLFTDCDSETGSSGGAVLALQDGAWRLVGITRGASPRGGPAYDRETAYHMAVPIAGAFRRAIEEAARGR